MRKKAQSLTLALFKLPRMLDLSGGAGGALARTSARHARCAGAPFPGPSMLWTEEEERRDDYPL